MKRSLRAPHPLRDDAGPCLTFAPLAWLKLQFFCHAGDTEIGGFALSSEEDLLYVEDFVTVRQEVSAVTVRFADEAVADFFDRCVDQGLHPERFSRIWLHTHPGVSVIPSLVDEETFNRSFGRCDWSLMFILGRTNKTYARLAFAAGPRGHMLLPTAVDWSAWPQCGTGEHGILAAKFADWQQEYAAHIHVSVQALCSLDLAQVMCPEEWWENQPRSPECDDVIYTVTENSNDRQLVNKPVAS